MRKYKKRIIAVAIIALVLLTFNSKPLSFFKDLSSKMISSVADAFGATTYGDRVTVYNDNIEFINEKDNTGILYRDVIDTVKIHYSIPSTRTIQANITYDGDYDANGILRKNFTSEEDYNKFSGYIEDLFDIETQTINVNGENRQYFIIKTTAAQEYYKKGVYKVTLYTYSRAKGVNITFYLDDLYYGYNRAFEFTSDNALSNNNNAIANSKNSWKITLTQNKSINFNDKYFNYIITDSKGNEVYNKSKSSTSKFFNVSTIYSTNKVELKIENNYYDYNCTKKADGKYDCANTMPEAGKYNVHIDYRNDEYSKAAEQEINNAKYDYQFTIAEPDTNNHTTGSSFYSYEYGLDTGKQEYKVRLEKYDSKKGEITYTDLSTNKQNVVSTTKFEMLYNDDYKKLDYDKNNNIVYHYHCIYKPHNKTDESDEEIDESDEENGEENEEEIEAQDEDEGEERDIYLREYYYDASVGEKGNPHKFKYYSDNKFDELKEMTDEELEEFLTNIEHNSFAEILNQIIDNRTNINDKMNSSISGDDDSKKGVINDYGSLNNGIVKYYKDEKNINTIRYDVKEPAQLSFATNGLFDFNSYEFSGYTNKVFFENAQYTIKKIEKDADNNIISSKVVDEINDGFSVVPSYSSSFQNNKKGQVVSFELSYIKEYHAKENFTYGGEYVLEIVFPHSTKVYSYYFKLNDTNEDFYVTSYFDKHSGSDDSLCSISASTEDDGNVIFKEDCTRKSCYQVGTDKTECKQVERSPQANKKYEYYIGLNISSDGSFIKKRSDMINVSIFDDRVDCEKDSETNRCRVDASGNQVLYYYEPEPYEMQLLNYHNNVVTFVINGTQKQLNINDFKNQYSDIYDILKIYTFDASGNILGYNSSYVKVKITKSETNSAESASGMISSYNNLTYEDENGVEKTEKDNTFKNKYTNEYIYYLNNFVVNDDNSITLGKVKGINKKKIRTSEEVKDVNKEFKIAYNTNLTDVENTIKILPKVEVNPGKYYVYVSYGAVSGIGYQNNKYNFCSDAENSTRKCTGYKLDENNQLVDFDENIDLPLSKNKFPEMYNQNIHSVEITYDPKEYYGNINDLLVKGMTCLDSSENPIDCSNEDDVAKKLDEVYLKAPADITIPVNFSYIYDIIGEDGQENINVVIKDKNGNPISINNSGSIFSVEKSEELKKNHEKTVLALEKGYEVKENLDLLEYEDKVGGNIYLKYNGNKTPNKYTVEVKYKNTVLDTYNIYVATPVPEEETNAISIDKTYYNIHFEQDEIDFISNYAEKKRITIDRILNNGNEHEENGTSVSNLSLELTRNSQLGYKDLVLKKSGNTGIFMLDGVDIFKYTIDTTHDDYKNYEKYLIDIDYLTNDLEDIVGEYVLTATYDEGNNPVKDTFTINLASQRHDIVMLNYENAYIDQTGMHYDRKVKTKYIYCDQLDNLSQMARYSNPKTALIEDVSTTLSENIMFNLDEVRNGNDNVCDTSKKEFDLTYKFTIDEEKIDYDAVYDFSVNYVSDGESGYLYDEFGNARLNDGDDDDGSSQRMFRIPIQPEETKIDNEDEENESTVVEQKTIPFKNLYLPTINSLETKGIYQETDGDGEVTFEIVPGYYKNLKQNQIIALYNANIDPSVLKWKVSSDCTNEDLSCSPSFAEDYSEAFVGNFTNNSLVLTYNEEKNIDLPVGNMSLIIYYNEEIYDTKTFEVHEEYVIIELDKENAIFKTYSSLSTNESSEDGYLFSDAAGYIKIPLTLKGISIDDLNVTINKAGVDGNYDNYLVLDKSKFKTNGYLYFEYSGNGLKNDEYEIVVSYNEVSDYIEFDIKKTFYDYVFREPTYSPDVLITNGHGKVTYVVDTEKMVGDDRFTIDEVADILTNNISISYEAEGNVYDVTEYFDIMNQNAYDTSFELVINYDPYKEIEIDGEKYYLGDVISPSTTYNVNTNYDFDSTEVVRSTNFYMADFGNSLYIYNTIIESETKDQLLHNNVGGNINVEYVVDGEFKLSNLVVNVYNEDGDLCNQYFDIETYAENVLLKLKTNPEIAPGKYTIYLIHTTDEGYAVSGNTTVTIYGNTSEIRLYDLNKSNDVILADEAGGYYTFKAKTFGNVPNINIEILDTYNNLYYSEFTSLNVPARFNVEKNGDSYKVSIIANSARVGKYFVRATTDDRTIVSNLLEITVDSTKYKIELLEDSYIKSKEDYNSERIYDREGFKGFYHFTSTYDTTDMSLYTIQILESNRIMYEFDNLTFDNLSTYFENNMMPEGTYEIMLCLNGLPYVGKKIAIVEYTETSTISLDINGNIANSFTLFKNGEYTMNIITNPIYASDRNFKFKNYDPSIIEIKDDKIIVKNMGVTNLTIENREASSTFKITARAGLESDIFTIDHDNLIIYIDSKYVDSQLRFKTSVLLKNLRNVSSSYKITDASGVKIDPDYIGTGMKLNNVTEIFDIVLYGDANGDGIISSKDYIRIKNHIMNTSKITNKIQKLGADANKDTSISSKDYIRIKNIIMNGVN